METTSFSREEMHAELRRALYQFVRCAAFISNEALGKRLLGDAKADPENPTYWLLSPESEPDHFGFDPKSWEIVDTMDRLYDYAMHGVARDPIANMSDESEYTFAAAFLDDFQGASLVQEINMGEGVAVAKCLHVAQLGVARVALDGGERFFHFGRFLPDDALSIREIALLAGMEENSVRNAAVKGKAGALPTFQKDGNTLVSRTDALEWLKGRKGFVATTRRYELGEVDLASRSFQFLGELDDYVDARCRALGLTEASVMKTLGVSKSAAKTFFGLYFTEGGSTEPAMLHRMAGLLEVDPRLFELRVKEAANLEEARRIRQALKDLNNAKPAA